MAIFFVLLVGIVTGSVINETVPVVETTTQTILHIPAE